VGRRRQLLPGGDENLERGHVAVGIIPREEEPNPQRTNLDGLFRKVTLVVRCSIIAPSLEFGEKGPARIPDPRRMAGFCLVV